MTDEMLYFLLSKAGSIRLNLAHACQSESLVAGGARQMGGAYSHNRHEGLRQHAYCTRPVWGDGRMNGEWHGLCSLCWHHKQGFEGKYRLMQLNPAAAAITDSALEKLFVTRRLSSWDRPAGDALPALGADLPDVFPAAWAA